jgi:hypothetical protein
LQLGYYREQPRREHWERVMAEFEHPYDPQQPGCICGRHRNQLEHEHETQHVLQCVPVASESKGKRYDGVLAREAMRVNFPKG